MRDGRIRIPLGLTVLEEVLPVLNATPAKIAVERQLIEELVDWEWIVQIHGDLIGADIEAYAHGEPPAFPFVSLDIKPRDVFDSTSPEHDVFKNIMSETRRQRIEQWRRLEQDVRSFKEQMKSDHKPTFEEFWNAAAPEFIRRRTKQFRVSEECIARGIDGLLSVKSVRLFAAWYVSWLYAVTYENERIKKSDLRDLQHVVCVSAVDIFVTLDMALRRLLERVPVEGFRVMSLQELLPRLPLYPNTRATTWKPASKYVLKSRSFALPKLRNSNVPIIT